MRGLRSCEVEAENGVCWKEPGEESVVALTNN